MPASYTTHTVASTASGSGLQFSVNYPYILQSHVKVYYGLNILSGAYTTLLADGTDYNWTSDTQITLVAAPSSQSTLTIIRETPTSAQLVPWQDGSNLIAEDLNKSDKQNLYAVQEQDDKTALASSEALTAKSASDTATATANSATATANSATTTANSAVVTANTANTNATAAQAAATSAQTSATNAAASATAAQTSATAAQASATAAAADAATANTNATSAQNDATSAVASAASAVTTANSASTAAANAVSTANAATSTANSAATDAAAAVSTANTANTNATTALNNSRQSDGQGGFTSAISIANTASTNASSAVTTANGAATDASSAVSTANTASTNASAAVTSANTANTTANNALSTVNTANTNATTALNNSRESDGQGGFVSAITKANTAITTANAASNAVSNAVLFDLVTNVSNIPSNPSNNDYAEVGDSTGIQNFTPLTGLPSGFTGASGLTVRLRYDSSQTSWVYMSYFANDSEDRYVAKGTVNATYFANQAAFPSATTYHGGVAHSHADGAMYYAHGGNWIELAKDSDVTTNATNISSNTTAIGTKLPLAGGTLTGNLTLNGAPTSTNHAATKGYVDTQVANVVDSAPGALDTLNELAAALGDDANFSTTVTNSIATKMPLAGGTFTGNVTFNANIDLQDNDKILVGLSDDLQIYHDGSNSYISNTGTGFLRITGSQVQLRGTNNESLGIFKTDAEVELYYNNALKLETKSDGIDVTGEVQCDSLDVDGGGVFDSEVYITGSTATTNRYLNFVDTGTGNYRATLRRDGWYLGNPVTNIGNTTPTGANIKLMMNGSATFAGVINVGGDVNLTSRPTGIELRDSGLIRSSRSSGSSNALEIYTSGTNATTATIKANGSATFNGTITAGGFNLSSLAALP